MTKETKKKTFYNEEFLDALKEKFGFSLDYIRKCLRGDRVGIMPDQIKAEYKALENELKKTVQTFKSKA